MFKTTLANTIYITGENKGVSIYPVTIRLKCSRWKKALFLISWSVRVILGNPKTTPEQSEA